MKQIKISIVAFVVCLSLLLIGCDLAKKVPEGKYLLIENKLELDEEYTFKRENIKSVLRQKPNHSSMGVRFKLIAYNLIDSAKVREKRIKKNRRLNKINERRKERAKRINERRIGKALNRGEKIYKPKTPKLRDTINPRPFFREWLKYEVGEPPVIFDSLTMRLSENQLKLYLKRKGYFNNEVSTSVELDHENRTATAIYKIKPKRAYMVDSFYTSSSNNRVRELYKNYYHTQGIVPQSSHRFDADKLTEFRKDFSGYMRDNSIFGFRTSYVSFEVDSLRKDYSLDINVKVAQRMVERDGEMVHKPFEQTKINNVYFHMEDTLTYDGNFKKDKLAPRSMTLKNLDRIPTFDTLRFELDKGKYTEYRKAYFLYNGKIAVRPELIEFQNLLEEDGLYKGFYIDQSFNRLLKLDLFQSVVPELVENEDNSIDVHYYLRRSRPQSFSFEPRATNSNGFLGVASSVNYQHKNIFGGGEKLKVSFSGGFESQPEVFDENLQGDFLSNAGRSFNTMEYGPTVELEIPGLFPAALSRLSKKQLPRTVISKAYNYQERDDFKRRLFQFNYLWKFSDTRNTQIFTVGLPLVGGFQFIQIRKSTPFQERLELQNDLFLLNAYSNQFIWKDLKLAYQYSNQEVRKGDLIFSYLANFDLAGIFAGLLQSNAPVNEDGFKEIFGVRYSQFTRLDNDLRLNHKLKRERSMNYRLQIGAGLPFGNNGPNLPFDYSFFAGGTNDNRGFRARSLGPGVYKYYLDTNRTATEIGDIRFGGSVEYRFKITGIFKGAVFGDFGNIWTINDDPNRNGGQFTRDWYKQLAVAGGAGLRVDLDFLVLRLDVGLPLRNPALPLSSRWIFQSKEAYIDEGIEVFGEEKYEELMPNPFRPQIHIAIGYPF